MTLSQLLEDQFRGDIRFRGESYLAAERVTISRVTPDRLFGTVQGEKGEELYPQLSRVDGELQMLCTCAAGQSAHIRCKHLWALILAVDTGEYLSASPKPGYFPPFAADTETPLSEWKWEDDGDDDIEFPTRSVQSQREARQLTPKLSEWEEKLSKLREQMIVPPVGPPPSSREREIFYEIDVESSLKCEQVVIQVSQRQRRTNGHWGKLKPLKIRSNRLQEIEHADDRRILAYLTGGTAERTSWQAQQTETLATSFRYRIPYELGQLILPLMCRSERVRYLHGSEKGVQPLQWDDGPPWELSMKLDFRDETDRWQLLGELMRDTEVLPFDAIKLMVPGGLVFTQTHIARLRDFDAFQWISLLQNGETVQIPAEQEDELVATLLDMPSLPRLDLPQELKLEEIKLSPTPCLQLTSPSKVRWQQDRMQGQVFFDYGGEMVRGSDQKWAIVQQEQKRCLVRDRVSETTAWSLLQEQGFRRIIEHRRTPVDVEISARDLGHAVRTLIQHGWRVTADAKQIHQAQEINFKIQSGIDWFELHADVQFDGARVSFPELLSAIARGDNTIRLDDGSLGILPEEWLQQYGILSGLGIVEDDHLRFNNHQVGILDALLASQPTFEFDHQFEQLRDHLSNFDELPLATVPADFHGDLRHYQQEGLSWLLFLNQFNLGGCLADDMGLGKTIQLLALLQHRRLQRKKTVPSLVVVPKSLIFNWKQECERFTPDLKVIEYTGSQRMALLGDLPRHDVVLTTYGTLRRDILQLKDIPFDYAVLDEAQIIKNANSQVAKASRLLAAQHRLALSGTPIENHLGDLWSIFEFLNPGMLGRSALFKSMNDDKKSQETRKLLGRALKPFILRRTKGQVATELPEKVEQTIFCDLGKKQQRQYDELRVHYRESLLGLLKQQGLARSKIHVLEALLRLRQSACHPALIDERFFEDPCAKLKVLCPYLEELIEEGHKALVFSQFTQMLAIVKHNLDKLGITYEYLDGQTRDRKRRVEHFQSDPDCGVFLISLKAGGLGLNLTAADYVFLLDPWWNPAVETQAIDRAHRMGQERPVFAYRLICRDTVEEKIASLQQQKRELAEAILEQDQNLLRDLSVEDLELLLS